MSDGVVQVSSRTNLIEKAEELNLHLVAFEDILNGQETVSADSLILGKVVQKYSDCRAVLQPSEDARQLRFVVKFTGDAAVFSRVKKDSVIGLAGVRYNPPSQTRRVHIVNENGDNSGYVLADSSVADFKLFVIVPNTANVGPGQCEEASYIYTHLADLQAASKLHCYGVVLEFAAWMKARPGLRVTLVDESTGIDHGVGFQITAASRDQLPKVERTGDILRLHRISIQEYNGKLEGSGYVGIYGFHALVFSGIPEADLAPTSHTSPQYTIDDFDRRRVQALRAWYSAQSLPASDSALLAVQWSFPDGTFQCLADLKPGCYINLVAGVLGIFKSPMNVGSVPCAVVRVWDGSKMPQLPNNQPFAASIQRDEVTQGIYCYSMCEWAESQGLAADIFVYDDHEAEAYALKVGQFALFNNLHSYHPKYKRPFEDGLPLALTIHGGSTFGRHIRRLPKDHPAVRVARRRMEALSLSDDYEAQTIGDYEQLISADNRSGGSLQNSASTDACQNGSADNDESAHTARCVPQIVPEILEQQRPQRPRRPSPHKAAAVQTVFDTPECSGNSASKRFRHSSQESTETQDVFLSQERSYEPEDTDAVAVADNAAQTTSVRVDVCDCDRLDTLSEGMHNVRVRLADFPRCKEDAWVLVRWCCTQCTETKLLYNDELRSLVTQKYEQVADGRRCQFDGCDTGPCSRSCRLMFFLYFLVCHCQEEVATRGRTIVVAGEAAERLLGMTLQDVWDDLCKDASRVGCTMFAKFQQLMETHVDLKLIAWKNADGSIELDIRYVHHVWHGRYPSGAPILAKPSQHACLALLMRSCNSGYVFGSGGV